MRIKDLCPEERPREKMRLRGARNLSNAELLAILLGSGTGGKSVMEVAQELMTCCGGRLSVLGSMPVERLTAQKGVGEARAIALVAALELGRRSFEEAALADKRSITSPEMVCQIMLPQLKGLGHEECWALYLTKANYLIAKEMICSGSLDNTPVDVQRILLRAIEKQSAQLILVHNHPSGSPLPSKMDISQTQALRNALATLNISLVDHVILSEDSFYSFSEERVGRM